MKTKCNICKSESIKIFDKKILNKYKIDYFQCSKCNFIQTEKPHWLDEVYVKSINISDTGLLARNIYLSKISFIFIYMYFDKLGTFLDYAGGYGIFTRLMRDIGFNFLWNDPYTVNLFAKGFEWNSNNNLKIELLTTFESFEHFVDPISELEKMLAISDNILFTTELIPKNNKDLENWWYLGLEHGQHISFYSKTTLEFLANKYNLHLYTNNINMHIFTKQKKYINIKTLQFLAKIGIYQLFKKRLTSKTRSDSQILNKN